MHFVLVDDERSHHDILKTRLQAACKQLNIPCEIDLTCETWQAAEAYAPQAPEGTVWFLDIELKDEGVFEGKYAMSVPGHATHLVRLSPDAGAGHLPCLVDVRDNSWRRPFEADRKRAKSAASKGDCDGCE